MPFVRGVWMRRVLAGGLAASLIALAGCGGGGSRTFHTQDSGGFRIFGGGKSAKGGDAPAIGVNGYLWRSTLDTLAFMPLASADPYGGIIITDWYSDPAQPSERFKATVYILDTRLRADGLNVAVHRQAKSATGEWQDAATSANTSESIERAILVRARQMRINGR